MADEHPSGRTDNPLSTIVNATNLPSTLKARAQRVFLRFLAGSLAHPYMQQVRQNLDDMDARSRINMMVAEEIGRQAIADSAFLDRAKARILGETIQKQQNLESVLITASEKIEQSENYEEKIAEEELSQDWINSFTREAELASSHELRERLANILAGEIKSPGAFSRSTIRTVAEMDQEILQQFSKALEYQFADAILTETSWNTGEMFDIGTALEHASLISGTSGFIQKEVKFDDTGSAAILKQGDALIIKGNPGLHKQVPCWILTKVGKQIASLLKEKTTFDQWKLFSDRIDKVGIISIHIGRVINNGTLLSKDRQLWPAPQPFNSERHISPSFAPSRPNHPINDIWS